MRIASRLFVPAAAILLAQAPARPDIADKLDEIAPEIECASWVAGAPQQIAKLRGRVVLLHLSDPEHLTSKAAVPPLRKLAEAWKAAPVSIVEVVIAPAEATATVYAAKETPAWPVGWDGKGTCALRFAGDSVPRTYLIGPDGRIVWHAHIGALTKDLVQGQVDRVQFFVPPADAKKARGVAKAAGEQRFGAALAEAARVEADKYASDADRALCAAARADVARTWDVQKKVLDSLVKENDWGIAWRRAQRMKSIFDGTDKEPAVAAEIAKLEARDIVPYVVGAQDLYEKILEDVPRAKSRKDLETLLDRCRNFEAKFGSTKPGARAATLREVLEKRLAEMDAK